MQIYWNKWEHLHKKRVQLQQDWFGTPPWQPFLCFWNTNMAALTSCENALYSCHPRCLSWSNLWNIFLEKLIVKGADYAANLSRGAFSQSPGKVILNFTFESRAVCIPKSSHWKHFYGLCLYECPSCFQNLYGRSWSRWKREDLKGAVSQNSVKLGNYKMPVKLKET